MKRGFALLATLLLVVTTGAMAKGTGPELYNAYTPTLSDIKNSSQQFEFFRQDTIWFGGDDGTGYAVEGQIWDFEGPGGDFQGWETFDYTANIATYFYRVTAADFANDPVVPMILGTTGQIWCGAHEDEANELCWVSGMGYANSFCQSAFSPYFNYAGGAIDIGFDYFADSEDDFDYTYINVLCYDAVGDLLEGGEVQVAFLHGDLGSPDSPLAFVDGLEAADIPAGTAQVRLEFRFVADGAWSDEDGLYDSIYGPFGGDNVTMSIDGAQVVDADFDTGADDFTFSKCAGNGTYMGLVDEATYTQWLDFVGLACSCTLSGWALEFVDEEGSQYTIPGHFAGQREMAISGIVDRAGYDPTAYNTTIVRWDQYSALEYQYGTFYRQGYKYYPFTCPTNPNPTWSGRMGQNTHYYTSAISCGLNGTNLTTLDGQAGDPLPNEWELMRFTYDVYCSCEGFGIPSTVCVEEGNTKGSPVIDNVRVGLTGAVDAPAIAPDTGHLWHDGFGQLFPTFLDPADVGNSSITWDLSGTNVDPDEENDWHGDTAMVVGPSVTTEEGRWLAELCFKVRPGPRQHLIPEYMTWKARLGGDPEADFVCVLMDSLETAQGVWKNKFESYFHEDDPGFNPAFADRTEEQEILPDLVFTPGTYIEYYYQSYWYDGGAPPEDYFQYGPFEFEILPGMEAVETTDSFGQDLYEVVWPCVLYVDAFNRGVEYYLNPMFEQLGLDVDKFDYLDASSNWHTPLARSFGGTTFNPGGYGNNGMTAEQALGYRLILVNTGTFGGGSMERKDWPLFEEWLTTTSCGLANIRRGLILDGDQVATVVDNYQPGGRDFLNNTLGTTLVWPAYRDYADDWEFCVFLEPDANAVFEVVDRDLSLYGNGCPNIYDYNVLGVQGGVSGTQGNYLFNDVQFAQVVRDHSAAGRDFLSIVNGFSLHHVSYVQAADDCPSDSASIVEGASSMVGAMLEWMTDPTQPWEKWQYPCVNLDVNGDEGQTHTSGPANFLFASRPNPFHNTATIRFAMASAGRVDIGIYDVSGRLVRNVVSGTMDAGENSVVWDGTDNTGARVGGGVYWMQMSTHDGFTSGKKMVVLR